MTRHAIVILAMFLPIQALAGPQYTAEDVIRYYKASHAAPAPAEMPANSRSIGRDAAEEDSPLAIPMTGVRSGYRVVPRAPSRSRAAAPSGYDLLVTFAMESAELTPQARENLDAFAGALRSPDLIGLRFSVEGYSDSSGAPAYNLRLSKARAAAVVAYLVGRGISPDRLIAHGFGETHPRLADPAAPGNRRVEARPVN